MIRRMKKMAFDNNLFIHCVTIGCGNGIKDEEQIQV